MKRYKWLAVMLMGSMLTGCGQSAQLLTTPQGGKENQRMTEEIGTKTTEVSVEMTANEALWHFSHGLLEQNLKETNPVLSPVSAYLALGMVALGAEGDTLAEFENTMGKELQSISGDLIQTIPSWIQDNGNDDKKSLLEVANSVWVDDRMHPADEWVKSVDEIYKAEAFQGRLSDQGVMKDINDWVENKTHSLVKEFLKEPLSDDSRLALFNTIYFLGKWVNEFEPNSTYKEDFITSGGDVKQVDMMHDFGRREYYVQGDGMDGVVMDYRDGSMALVALKPTAGQTVREMYESLTYDELTTLLDSGTKRKVNLKLPKFEVEFDKNLNETLQNMGIKRAFDGNLAEFGGLGTTDDGYPLCLSLVRQKAVVKLDEEGTEAAAVTMVVMMECAAIESTEVPVDVFFDEPFLYMIMDMETKTPLFMGILDEP